MILIDLHLQVLIGVGDTIFIFFFFFNDTATTEIYTLSLHDALPISRNSFSYQSAISSYGAFTDPLCEEGYSAKAPDRKSTRLNSSHSQISYAVFCLKKKNQPTM